MMLHIVLYPKAEKSAIETIDYELTYLNYLLLELYLTLQKFYD